MICLDSSVVVKVILDEEQSDLARALYDSLILEQTLIVAPPLLPIEMTNVLRKRMRRENAISLDAAMNLFEVFLALPIAIHNPPGIHQQALRLADAFELPASYDAHYLALAEFMNCEFWTADQRLWQQVERGLPFVRWIGNYRV
jgi:predicted nucleic acid-binding protein